MNTLRDLYEEALHEKANAKLSKGMAGVVGYNRSLKKGGQWPGPEIGMDGKMKGKGANPFHDEFGRFSGGDNATSVSWGSKKLSKAGRKPGGQWKNVTKGKESGRYSGTGKLVDTQYGRPNWTDKKARVPSKGRVLVRTGKPSAKSDKLGSFKDRVAQLANLVGADKAAAILAKHNAKGKGKKGGGGQGNRMNKAQGYDMAYGEAEELFLGRLLEGTTDPASAIDKVDYARTAVAEAINALSAIPDCEDYEEIVESANALSYAWDMLDYED